MYFHQYYLTSASLKRVVGLRSSGFQAPASPRWLMLIQEILYILYMIDTKIFQFDPLEAEKLRLKDAYPH